MVLVGPSGCGKTTALRMVAGLEEISHGVLRIGERVVNYVPSRDRDIAMVFQSYALYPHLSVYENIAFGLRVKKLPKDEIDRRVQDAAKTLDLEPFLKRKPRALSGGQRQRVAMGRAIVRQPQAFLMDEPLSNLDAKLRVQMRADISQLQRSLKVTTVYVTHDQIEAMTMGDRVAVMRKGELQQVATPQELYDTPVNLFVGGFIGSPSMNMLEATIEQSNGNGLAARIGDQTLQLDDELVSTRSDLKNYVGKTVIVGIRPEDLEDAALARDIPEREPAEGRREACGRRSAPRSWCTPRSRPRRPPPRTSRSSPRTSVTSASRTQTDEHAHRRPLQRTLEGPRGRRRRDRRRHPHDALLRSRHRSRHLRRRDPIERGARMRSKHVAVAVGAAAIVASAIAVTTAGAQRDHQAAPGRQHRRVGQALRCSASGRARSRSRSRPSWTRSRRSIRTSPCRTSPAATSCRRCSRPGRRPPPAGPGGGLPAGPDARLRQEERAQADHLRPRRDRRELRAGVADARHRPGQALRPGLQGRQQVDRLVQRPAVQERRREGRRRRGRSSWRWRSSCGARAPRPTRSAAATAGRSPTSSRTSTCARPARRSTTR